MTRRSSASTLDLAGLPNVWRVPDLARETATLSSGLPALDAVLPGGGWPVGCMVEVLQRAPGQHVWQLLLPSLGLALSRHGGPVVLVAPPHQPFGPSLAAQGLPPERLLCIHGEQPAARRWAAEQALRCGEVAAVLAWLPATRAEELRRLHLAAQQQQRPFFVFRQAGERHEASPAPLRLLVDGVDVLEVEVLKRRGPPLPRPLHLPAMSARLAALLQARRGGIAPAREAVPAPRERSHGLDRTAALH